MISFKSIIYTHFYGKKKQLLVTKLEKMAFILDFLMTYQADLHNVSAIRSTIPVSIS